MLHDREPLDVLEAIHSAPSRRYLKPDPIPDEVIRELVDAAIRAPNGGNQQRWAWIAVRDQGIKDQIAPKFREWVESVLDSGAYDLRETHPGRGLSGSASAGALHLATHLAESPVLMVPVAREVGRWAQSINSGLLIGSSIYPSVQNLLLAARAFGLGATLAANPKVLEEWGVNRMLGLPEGDRALHLIPVGYPARGKFSQPRRMPVEQVLHWDRWDAARA